MRTITLTGDSTRDNENITGVFSTTAPIALKDSKLALLSCNAKIPLITANEVFPVTAGSSFTWNTNTVTIPAGTYSYDGPDVTTSFIKAVQAAWGYTGSPLFDEGVEVDYDVVNGKSTFTVHGCDNVTQAFNDATMYEVISGAPTLIAGGFTGDGTACEIISAESIPNASFTFEWTNASVAGVGQANDYTVGVGDSAIWHGLSVVNGVYHKIQAGVLTSLGLAYTNADVLRVSRVNNSYTLNIDDTLGANKFTVTYTATLQDWIDQFGGTTFGSGAGGFSVLYVQSPVGSTQAITGATGTTFSGAATMAVTSTFNFPNAKLMGYLGFSYAGPWSNTGTPAVVIGDLDVEGDDKFPPIELVLTGPQLETYTGSINDRDAKSVLYTINNTRAARGLVIPDIHNILKLDIKNPDTRLSSLGCYFRLPFGNRSKLQFSGNPVIVLGLYGPGEQ